MLFRKKVLDRRQARLHGAVIISSPLSFWVVAFLLLGILVAAIGFAAVGTFAKVESVPGVVVPSDGVAEVRAPVTGVVERFNWSEGDTVTAGQFMGQITVGTAAASQGSRLAAELRRIDMQASNLRLQLEQTRSLADIEVSGLIEEAAQVETRIEHLSRVLQLRVAAANETRVAYERIASLSELEVASERQLSAERLRSIAADQQVAELESELAEQSASLTVLLRQREAVVARAELSVSQLQAELQNLTAERAVLLASQRYAITAPVDGRVSAITIRAGHEVRQGEQLFSLLPIDHDIQVELYIPSSAIGFVEPGLPVRAMLDAFPYQQFGTIEGEIREVTTTVMEPRTGLPPAQGPRTAFRAIVNLHTSTMTANGREYPVQPGMTLSANIILADRTILSRVLDPIISVLRRY